MSAGVSGLHWSKMARTRSLMGWGRSDGRCPVTVGAHRQLPLVKRTPTACEALTVILPRSLLPSANGQMLSPERTQAGHPAVSSESRVVWAVGDWPWAIPFRPV